MVLEAVPTRPRLTHAAHEIDVGGAMRVESLAAWKHKPRDGLAAESADAHRSKARAERDWPQSWLHLHSAHKSEAKSQRR